jgi:hypothetical protein
MIVPVKKKDERILPKMLSLLRKSLTRYPGLKFWKRKHELLKFSKTKCGQEIHIFIQTKQESIGISINETSHHHTPTRHCPDTITSLNENTDTTLITGDSLTTHRSLP